MQNVDFPYHFDGRNHTADSEELKHIRDLIQQLLFTTPGERVMRPTFGSGLLQLTFAPNSQELAAATKMLMHGALQEWLGDRIVVNDVQIIIHESQLQVEVDYIVKKTQQQQVDSFSGADA